MIAAEITAPGQARIGEFDPPAPGPGEVAIQVARAGICGTDLHIWHGGYEVARYPLIPGHEFSGTVVAVGDGVLEPAIGDRVTADPNLPCGSCAACRRGHRNQCRRLGVVGVNRPGAFAEQLVVPASAVYPIGDLSFAEAALIEPLACVVWGLERVAPAPGSSALVLGAGPMGCLLLQGLARAGAASVTVTDVNPRRLELAAELGANVTLHPDELTPERRAGIVDGGFDVVVDATGLPRVIESAIDHLAPRGTLWVFGVAPSGTRISVSPFELFRRDLRIVGSFALDGTFHESIAWIRSGAVRVAPLVSHVVPLGEFVEGVRLAGEAPDRMKVQFEP